MENQKFIKIKGINLFVRTPRFLYSIVVHANVVKWCVCTVFVAVLKTRNLNQLCLSLSRSFESLNRLLLYYLSFPLLFSHCAAFHSGHFNPFIEMVFLAATHTQTHKNSISFWLSCTYVALIIIIKMHTYYRNTETQCKWQNQH